MLSKNWQKYIKIVNYLHLWYKSWLWYSSCTRGRRLKIWILSVFLSSSHTAALVLHLQTVREILRTIQAIILLFFFMLGCFQLVIF